MNPPGLSPHILQLLQKEILPPESWLLFHFAFFVIHIPSWYILLSKPVLLVVSSIFDAVWLTTSISIPVTLIISPSIFTSAPFGILVFLGFFSPKKFFIVNSSPWIETFIGKCPEHIFNWYS